MPPPLTVEYLIAFITHRRDILDLRKQNTNNTLEVIPAAERGVITGTRKKRFTSNLRSYISTHRSTMDKEVHGAKRSQQASTNGRDGRPLTDDLRIGKLLRI